MSSKKSSTSTGNSALAEQYQQKTDKEHILDNPDTYIGSVENVDASLWVYDEDQQKICYRKIGLLCQYGRSRRLSKKCRIIII